MISIIRRLLPTLPKGADAGIWTPEKQEHKISKKPAAATSPQEMRFDH